MTWILIKKQMMEIFRSYFYDSKKNKKRSTVSTILFMLIYAVMMVGVLGGMFAYFSKGICGPFAAVNMSWLYFLIMSMVAVSLGSFGSVFNTYSGLYMSKDNDLLLSMPVPVRTILIARLAGVYLLGLMYSAVVIVPAVIVYWVVAKCTVLNVIGSILLIVIISLIVLILSCILGWCVAKISRKLKNKSFITVLASLLFFAAYYFVFFKAQEVINKIMVNAVVYGENVKNKAYPVYMFGRIGEGDISAMLIYTVVIVILCALIYRVLSGSFINIVTSNNTVSKVRYKEKKSKMKNQFAAVLSKEFARFFASPSYMLNCGLGSLFLFVLGVVFIVKGHSLVVFADTIFQYKEAVRMVPLFFAVAICATAAMNDIVVPSVSLEGKNLWVLRSLPVKTWDIFRAKLAVQFIFTGIPVLFCDICMLIVFRADIKPVTLIMLFILPILYMVFMLLFGMLLGISFVNLTWTNETAPIKQSLNIFIAMFGGWIFAIAVALVFIVKAYKIGLFMYVIIVDMVFVALSVMLYIWMKKIGVAKFENL